MNFDFVLTAGVFVTVSGFVGAKGSVGTTTSGQVDLQGGNSRPPWKSLPGAAASMVLGLYNGPSVYGDAVVYDGCSSEVTGLCNLELVRTYKFATPV